MSEEKPVEKTTFSFLSLLPSLGNVTIEIPAKTITFSITGFILFVIGLMATLSVYTNVDFNKLYEVATSVLK